MRHARADRDEASALHSSTAKISALHFPPAHQPLRQPAPQNFDYTQACRDTTASSRQRLASRPSNASDLQLHDKTRAAVPPVRSTPTQSQQKQLPTFRASLPSSPDARRRCQPPAPTDRHHPQRPAFPVASLSVPQLRVLLPRWFHDLRKFVGAIQVRCSVRPGSQTTTRVCVNRRASCPNRLLCPSRV